MIYRMFMLADMAPDPDTLDARDIDPSSKDDRRGSRDGGLRDWLWLLEVQLTNTVLERRGMIAQGQEILFLLFTLFHRLDGHGVHHDHGAFRLGLHPSSSDHLVAFDPVSCLELGPFLHKGLELGPKLALGAGQEGERHDHRLEQVPEKRRGRVGMFVLEVKGSSEVGQGRVGVLLEEVELVVDEHADKVLFEVMFLTGGQDGRVACESERGSEFLLTRHGCILLMVHILTCHCEWDERIRKRRVGEERRKRG